jgi:hypothetical protein
MMGNKKKKEKAEARVVWHPKMVVLVVVIICFINCLPLQVPEKYKARLASMFCTVFY